MVLRPWTSRSLVLASLLAGLAALLSACGSGDGGKRLGDCEYAAKLQSALESFGGSATALGQSDPSDRDATLRSVDALDAQLARLVGDLRELRSAGEMEKFNRDLIDVFSESRKDVGELKKAVQAGDMQQAEEKASVFSEGVFTRLEKVQRDHRGAGRTLQQCG